MRTLIDRVALLMVTAWVGSLWAVGYLAAPALFYELAGNRQLAGALAGHMFVLVAYVGMFSALCLMTHRIARFGAPALKQGFFWVVVVMLLLTLVSHFGIQPLLAQIKLQALPSDVMQSVFRDRFSAWHGVASIAYLVQSLLGVYLVLKAR